MNLFINRFFILLLIFCASFLSGCSENFSPEKRALEIAGDSHVLDSDKTVSRFIRDYIEQKGDNAKPVGWNSERQGNNKYLVSYKYQLYSFNEGIGEKGFFFEVNLDDESVIDRTREYLEKMKPLSKAYASEKDIFKEVINESESLKVVE